MLTRPPRAEVKEWPGSVTWFDEDGILCSISTKSPPATLAETKRTIEKFKEHLDGKKVCLLVDVTERSESTKEVRDYAAAELPNIVKAIAMVSDSALGSMLANLFFTLKTQSYPTKMFKTEKEAKEWLKQYL